MKGCAAQHFAEGNRVRGAVLDVGDLRLRAHVVNPHVGRPSGLPLVIYGNFAQASGTADVVGASHFATETWPVPDKVRSDVIVVISFVEVGPGVHVPDAAGGAGTEGILGIGRLNVVRRAHIAF